MERIVAILNYTIFEALTFLFAFSIMFNLVSAANKQIAFVNSQVQRKSTITSHYDKDTTETLKVSGKNVYSDIINLDDSLKVYINNTLLNAETMRNGKNFLEYLRNTDSTILEPYILFEHEYTKTVLVDTNGKVIGIRFSL